MNQLNAMYNLSNKEKIEQDFLLPKMLLSLIIKKQLRETYNHILISA